MRPHRRSVQQGDFHLHRLAGNARVGEAAEAPRRRSRGHGGAHLDAAYRTTAASLPANAAVQVAGDDLALSALDRLEEPASLVALRAAVQGRMPRLDLPELLLEMHARTGFADGFTHASEGGARAGGVAVSLCAVLLAEACNTGLDRRPPPRPAGGCARGGEAPGTDALRAPDPHRRPPARAA